jgi:anti-sigma factor RsiW
MRSESAPGAELTCVDLHDELAGDHEAVLSAPARLHVAQCLRCQAEMANYRRLRRSLRALADSPVAVDPALEHDILLALDDHDDRLSRRVPGYAAATLGGLAAAAGVIVLATRQRRGARLAG